MLSRHSALALQGVSGGELEDLCAQAVQLRKQHYGERLTYSRKVFVPLTTLCRDDCGYCTFVQRPGSPGAKVMTPAEVMEVVLQGQQLGCKEVLFSLGEKPERRYQQARDALAALGYQRMTDYLAACCDQVLEQSSLMPHVNAGTLDEDELRLLKPRCLSMGMMLETMSRRLLQKGGAHYACPDKVPLQRIRTLERAGRLQVPFTTGILIGIGETWDERIDSLLLINRLHAEYGHIQEVIIQNFCAKPGTPMANYPEPSLEEMLRTLAVARLLLHPSISLQAPPNLQQRYGHYIQAGINDWGGISPLTRDYINPEKAWPQLELLAAACAEQGCLLEERLALYPAYQQQPGFVEAAVQARLAPLCRADGLAQHQCLAS
ncbi:7,8-didemethyl-8-hydroxy-5-deazariboflavin synthase CofG [Balneatrix alpica]|uniref:7,8-didemethyl-8-hydroxy-5-deazariboflavin synthase CofG n=1 Tax=Balneatrix alpica TaxID=75684 RepID=UPI00273A3498|nr:7,8-didemethyl-8-hydroxy-5-deazariboflavin synthase CofG [Balneatrix alpica]